MKIPLPFKSIINACLTLLVVTGLNLHAIAQAPKQPDTMTKLLDYSRPGPAHSNLEKLAGTWSFQDAKLSFVKGTLLRRPIYNDRFLASK